METKIEKKYFLGVLVVKKIVEFSKIIHPDYKDKVGINPNDYLTNSGKHEKYFLFGVFKYKDVLLSLEK